MNDIYPINEIIDELGQETSYCALEYVTADRQITRQTISRIASCLKKANVVTLNYSSYSAQQLTNAAKIAIDFARKYGEFPLWGVRQLGVNQGNKEIGMTKFLDECLLEIFAEQDSSDDNGNKPFIYALLVNNLLDSASINDIADIWSDLLFKKADDDPEIEPLLIKFALLKTILLSYTPAFAWRFKGVAHNESMMVQDAVRNMFDMSILPNDNAKDNHENIFARLLLSFDIIYKIANQHCMKQATSATQSISTQNLLDTLDDFEQPDTQNTQGGNKDQQADNTINLIKFINECQTQFVINEILHNPSYQMFIGSLNDEDNCDILAVFFQMLKGMDSRSQNGLFFNYDVYQRLKQCNFEVPLLEIYALLLPTGSQDALFLLKWYLLQSLVESPYLLEEWFDIANNQLGKSLLLNLTHQSFTHLIEHLAPLKLPSKIDRVIQNAYANGNYEQIPAGGAEWHLNLRNPGFAKFFTETFEGLDDDDDNINVAQGKPHATITDSQRFLLRATLSHMLFAPHLQDHFTMLDIKAVANDNVEAFVTNAFLNLPDNINWEHIKRILQLDKDDATIRQTGIEVLLAIDNAYEKVLGCLDNAPEIWGDTGVILDNIERRRFNQAYLEIAFKCQHIKTLLREDNSEKLRTLSVSLDKLEKCQNVCNQFYQAHIDYVIWQTFSQQSLTGRKRIIRKKKLMSLGLGDSYIKSIDDSSLSGWNMLLTPFYSLADALTSLHDKTFKQHIEQAAIQVLLNMRMYSSPYRAVIDIANDMILPLSVIENSVTEAFQNFMAVLAPQEYTQFFKNGELDYEILHEIFLQKRDELSSTDIVFMELFFEIRSQITQHHQLSDDLFVAGPSLVDSTLLNINPTRTTNSIIDAFYKLQQNIERTLLSQVKVKTSPVNDIDQGFTPVVTTALVQLSSKTNVFSSANQIGEVKKLICGTVIPADDPRCNNNAQLMQVLTERFLLEMKHAAADINYTTAYTMLQRLSKLVLPKLISDAGIRHIAKHIMSDNISENKRQKIQSDIRTLIMSLLITALKPKPECFEKYANLLQDAEDEPQTFEQAFFELAPCLNYGKYKPSDNKKLIEAGEVPRKDLAKIFININNLIALAINRDFLPQSVQSPALILFTWISSLETERLSNAWDSNKIQHITTALSSDINLERQIIEGYKKIPLHDVARLLKRHLAETELQKLYVLAKERKAKKTQHVRPQARDVIQDLFDDIDDTIDDDHVSMTWAKKRDKLLHDLKRMAGKNPDDVSDVEDFISTGDIIHALDNVRESWWKYMDNLVTFILTQINRRGLIINSDAKPSTALLFQKLKLTNTDQRKIDAMKWALYSIVDAHPEDKTA